MDVDGPEALEDRVRLGMGKEDVIQIPGGIPDHHRAEVAVP